MVRSKVLLDPAVELFEVLSCFRVDVVLDFVEALVFRVGQFAFGVDRSSMGVGVVGVLRSSGPNNVLGVLARVHKLWMSWSLKACVRVDLVDPNTASLGCLGCWWLEPVDRDGVHESGRGWFGALACLEAVVGSATLAGRAPARPGPHPAPGELGHRACSHPHQVLRGKKPRRSTRPSGERNW